ncbi:MAG: NAD(P)H-dependent oxidoreductase subunit E [Leptotrichiaceae bacterium]|jgi:NADH-quinone oxidoreductase subunit E/NADP-reducing hydrogenase subunit HndA|nr:NAD(P)H-dependent oxidoreductase subunit E [Leptotrichiaceae bacterium]
MSCDNRLKKECFTELETFINSLADKNGALISVLHKAQEIFGYLPEEVQTFVAEQLGISVAKVYGVVSFYSFFTMTPKGKFPIAVCMGTACYVRGAEKVLHEFQNQLGIKTGETTVDGLFSIDALRCVGACGLAPVVLVGEDVYGRDEAKDVKTILKKYREMV